MRRGWTLSKHVQESRADFNVDGTTVVVPVEDLFEANYIQEA